MDAHIKVMAMMMSPMSLVQWLNNLRLLGIDGRVDQLYIGERIQARIFEWWHSHSRCIKL